MKNEMNTIDYVEGREYVFLTVKHKKSDTNKILTELVDSANSKHVILGELLLNKKVRLTVSKVKNSGRLSLKANTNYLLEKEHLLKVLRVKDSYDKTHKVFVLLSHDNNKYNIPLLRWQYSTSYKIPECLRCSIYNENERTSIRQIIDDSNKHPLFVKGDVYEFKFLKFEEDKLKKRRYLIVLGTDNIQYRVEAQLGQEYGDLKGKVIRCKFVDYDRKGEIYLLQHEKFFVTVSKIFKNINEDNFIQTLRRECESSSHFQKFLTQYQQRDNRWLLSLSNTLINLSEEYIKRCLFNESIRSIQLLFAAEQYILTSTYLNFFKPEVQTQVISTGQTALQYYKSILEPLGMLSSLTYENFINVAVEDPNANEQEAADNLKKIYQLLKIAPNEYINDDKVFEWFNKMGETGKFLADTYLTDSFSKWLYNRCKKIERDVLEKIFFNNDEKKKYYKSNKKLLTLINYYILLYNINTHVKLNFNNKIFLSKILRCLILYKNDRSNSSLLTKTCVGMLYDNFQLEMRFRWSYYKDVVEIEKIFNQYSSTVLTSDIDFIGQKQGLQSSFEGLFNGELQSKTRFGYKILIDNYTGILSSRSIHDYEANFYLNNRKSFHPKFRILAIDESAKQVLFEYAKNESPFFKRKIDVTKVIKGAFLQGLIKSHTKSGSFVDLGNVMAFVHRKEIDWGPVSYVEDFLSVGEVKEFMIKEVAKNSEGDKINLSRKYCFQDPYIHVKKCINKKYIGRFLRHIDLSFLNEYHRLNVNLNESGIELVSCPICLNMRSVENKNLVVDKDKRTWYCSDTDCGFHGEEILLFRIDDINLTTAVRVRTLEKQQNNVLSLLERGDFALLRIVFVEFKSRYVYSEIEDQEIKKSQRSIEIYESTPQDKELILELARVYEDIASTQKQVKQELEFLHWAQHYFALANHAKSYYYNVYISLVEILSELETSLEKVPFDEGVIERIRAKAVSFVNNIQDFDKTLANYTILENHISIIKTLTLLTDERKEINNQLFELIFESNDSIHMVCKKISKIVLSYNILFNEMNNRSLINKEWALKLYAVLKEGFLEIKELKIDLNEKFEIDSRRRAEEVLLLIHKGEGKNIEFKSSLFTPVLDKKRIVELEKFQKKLQEAAVAEDAKSEAAAKKAIEGLTGSAVEGDLKFAAIKEIAAFANSSGGTLIIGVNDEKKPIGLENDFQKLTKTDKYDEFKLRFDNIVKEYLGESSFDLINTEFVKIEDKDIFLIEVQPIGRLSEPLWVNKNEKGNTDSLLFIRAESSARCLIGKEIANFYLRRKEHDQV